MCKREGKEGRGGGGGGGGGLVNDVLNVSVFSVKFMSADSR